MIISLTLLTFVLGHSDFCGYIDHTPKFHTDRKLIDSLTRDSGWSGIRLSVDWSQASDSTQSKYNKTLESAFTYYSNSLSVHSITSESSWDSYFDFSNSYCESFSVYSGVPIQSSDFLMMILEEYDEEASYIARATSCAYDPVTLQPIAGLILLNLPMMNNREEDQLIMIFTHEVAHSLGFASSHMLNYQKPDGSRYAYDELFAKKSYRGISDLLFLKTPNVLKRARIAFDCEDLPGLQLENQGDPASASSHWESRIMRTEFMNPQIVPHNAVFSDLTLALFEDSGWYMPDYSYAGNITWGFKAGCEFHEQKCISDKEKPRFDEFCSDQLAESLCSGNLLDKGICFMREYDEEISREYRYFDDFKLGGNLYTDYCPIVTGTINCRTLRLGNKEYGEEFCEECRCIEGTYSKSKELERVQGTCHRIDCIDGNVYITIGTVSVKCSKTGEWVKVKGFKGKLKCPDMEKVCRPPPCTNNCYGEKCYSGSCSIYISQSSLIAYTLAVTLIF